MNKEKILLELESIDNYYDKLEHIAKVHVTRHLGISHAHILFAKEVMKDVDHANALREEFLDHGFIHTDSCKYVEHEDFIPYLIDYINKVGY